MAIFGNLPWSSMTILPGLVASGGALLFGVNAWCLDGRGALWRENLPVPASALFDARAWVLTEFLAIASLITIGIGALRAGIPNAVEFSALVCTLLVVLLQVVGASMRWSQAHPYPVDLRSARATPAPPAAMVGYSARLAVSTTFTSLIFSGCANVPDWRLSVVLAIPCLLWSGVRFARTASEAGRTRSPGPSWSPPRLHDPRSGPPLGSEHGLRSLSPGRRPDRAGRGLHGHRDHPGRGRLPPRPGRGTAYRRSLAAAAGPRRAQGRRRAREGCGTSSCRRQHAGEYAARFGTDGGEGLTNVDYAPLAEQMGRSAIAPLVFNCNAPDTGNMEVLLRYGSEEQRREWLEPLLDGRIRSAFTMTEPEVASSDATNMAATCVVDGDEVVVNGRKWWSTGVGHPDCRIFVFMGVTDPDADRHHRHSMVLVPRDTPGVTIERLLPDDGDLRRAARPRRGVVRRRPGAR